MQIGEGMSSDWLLMSNSDWLKVKAVKMKGMSSVG